MNAPQSPEPTPAQREAYLLLLEAIVHPERNITPRHLRAVN